MENNILADAISRARSLAELPKAVEQVKQVFVCRGPARWRMLDRVI